MDSRTDSNRSIAARLHLSRRSLQIALGLIWIFDGLLKFQPALFKPAFVDVIIRPMALGQPTVVASTINHMANFLSHEATMWVAIFGLIEIAIGAAMLSPRTVKPALVTSFIWGGGIYLFGEGFGMVLTGHTSPLAGAPGAVCFYVLLGAMVWPRQEADPDRVRVGCRLFGCRPWSLRRNGRPPGLGGHLGLRRHHLDVSRQPRRRCREQPDVRDGEGGTRLVRPSPQLLRPCLHGRRCLGGRAPGRRLNRHWSRTVGFGSH
jgi:hypothetical protein